MWEDETNIGSNPEANNKSLLSSVQALNELDTKFDNLYKDARLQLIL